jgi:hypothetical protein
MRFDILGRTSARVTSIATSSGASRATAGSFRFRPGVLEQAPQTFVAPLKGPSGAARAPLQHDLVERFPNVSVIDFARCSRRCADVMSKVTLAITVVGGLVLFSGGADSDRCRGDDQVPARLRRPRSSRRWREHPDDRADAAVRVRACSGRWPG